MQTISVLLSFFGALFDLTYQQCRSVAPKHKFAFKNKPYSMDATVVSFCLSLFPWAKFRKTKGGVRLHTVLDHDGYLPAFLEITGAKKHEVRVARSMHLPKGSIVAIDKGYTDYRWLGILIQNGVCFVTRQKRNAQYRDLARRKVLKVKQIKSIGISRQALLVKTKSTKPKKGKWVYSLLITNLRNQGPVSLVNPYNQRQAIEKEIQQIKSVLGLKHKRKESFHGMAALELLTLMANNLLVWFKMTLPKSIHHLGLKRLVHEILAIPESVRGFAEGFKVAIESQYAFLKILLSLSSPQQPLPLRF